MKRKRDNTPWLYMKTTRRNDGNPNWKADKVGKRGVHGWVTRNWILPTFCDICGSNERRLEWSNKDHKYTRIREQWQAACRPCHMAFDKENNQRFKNYGRLKKWKWSIKHPKCIRCGTDKRKHKANGMCTACSHLQYKEKAI